MSALDSIFKLCETGHMVHDSTLVNARAELAQLRAECDTFRDLLVYLNAASAKDAYSAVIQLSAEADECIKWRAWKPSNDEYITELEAANAAMAQQLEQAREIISHYEDCPTGGNCGMRDIARAWLAANAPAETTREA